MSTGSTTTASDEVRGRLVGLTLRPRELEREYRASRLPEDGRDAAIVVGALTGLSSLFVVNDLAFARNSPVLPALFAVRALYVGAGVLVVVLGIRARRRNALDLSILASLVIGALFTIVLQSTRPPDFYLPALQNMLGALLAWTVIPNRFGFQALAAAVVTGSCFAWIALFRVPPAPPVALLLVMSLLSANLAGAFISWRLQRGRRLQFLAERDQQAALVRLQASEDLFRSAFENASIGKALTSPDGIFLRVNAAMARFLGYAPGELVGKTAWEVSHPEDRPASRELAADLAAGRDRPPLVKRYVRKDGSVVWGELSTSVVRNPDGQVRHFVSGVVDVDQRHRAEAALAASRSRYTELYEGLGDGVCFVTMDGLLVDFNETYRGMLGYEAAELRTMRYQDLTPERWAEEEFRHLARLLEGQGSAVTYEKEYRRKDGTVFPVELRASVRREGGVPVGLWAVVRDISREKALRDRLAVASRLASMGTLVAGVAHEVNNPLGGAMASHGFAAEEVAAIRARIREGSPLEPGPTDAALAEVEQALADAQSGERRIAAIVKDLTILGRPGAPRGRIAPAQAVREALSWLPAELRARAEVSVHDRDAPDLLAAPGQIVQVLVNVIANAIRSTPASRAARIAVRLGPGEAGMARLEVEDDGTGMTPDVLEHMFDPFFTTRGPGQGMGLGLAICHAIVSAHGGTITARSAPGQGTTIRLDLPAAA